MLSIIYLYQKRKRPIHKYVVEGFSVRPRSQTIVDLMSGGHDDNIDDVRSSWLNDNVILCIDSVKPPHIAKL